MPNTDPTTIDPTTIVLLAVVYAVVLLGGYVWLSLALSRVFPKLGEEGWKAWVPVLREMTVFQLGGYSSAWVVALFLPFINIIGLVVTVLAVHQINKQLGRDAVFTVLAVVAYPVWATIVGFGTNDRAPRPVVSRPTGYQPFAELPQSASAGGPVAAGTAAVGAAAAGPAPGASAASARTFGEGSPFHLEAAAPVPPAPVAPPVPPAARPAPLAVTVATPFSAAGPPPPSPAGGQIAFQPIPQAARTPVPPAPPIPPTPSAPPAAPDPGAPPALIDPAAAAWSPPATQLRPSPESMPLFLEAAVAPVPPAAGAPVAGAPAARAPVASPVAAPTAPTTPPAPITPPPAAFPTLPTAAAEADAIPAIPETPYNAVPDTEHTVIPASAPAGADLDDDDFEDTVIVNRREELWVLSPEGAEPIRVTRPVALLGRNPSASPEHPDAQLIRLTDPARTVSKTHARIELVSGAWMIIDLASTNGVYLRGDDGADVELDADVPTTLTPAFRLGELPFRLERED